MRNVQFSKIKKSENKSNKLNHFLVFLTLLNRCPYSSIFSNLIKNILMNNKILQKKYDNYKKMKKVKNLMKKNEFSQKTRSFNQIKKQWLI